MDDRQNECPKAQWFVLEPTVGRDAELRAELERLGKTPALAEGQGSQDSGRYSYSETLGVFTACLSEGEAQRLRIRMLVKAMDLAAQPVFPARIPDQGANHAPTVSEGIGTPASEGRRDSDAEEGPSGTPGDEGRA